MMDLRSELLIDKNAQALVLGIFPRYSGILPTIPWFYVKMSRERPSKPRNSVFSM